MKLGFSTLGCPGWGIEEMLGAARANGYDGVELRFYKGSLELPKALADFPGGVTAFRRRFESGGVEICCVDSSVVLSAPEISTSEGEEMIELALKLGAPYVRVFGGKVQEGEDRGACLKRAADKLARLGQRAARRGLTVLVETHDAFSSGAEVAELLDMAGEEGIGALWDLHHPVSQGETPAETARLIGSRTYHVHVKDGKKDGGNVLLGEGDIPLRELVSELHRTGYKGYLCLEWEKAWMPDLAEPEVAFPHAARYLTELLGELKIPRG